jgi:hypothetical protein
MAPMPSESSIGNIGIESEENMDIDIGIGSAKKIVIGYRIDRKIRYIASEIGHRKEKLCKIEKKRDIMPFLVINRSRIHL